MKPRPSLLAVLAVIALSVPIVLAAPLGARPRHAPAGARPAAVPRPIGGMRRSYLPHEVLVRFADAAPRPSRANAVARALPFARMMSIRGTQLDRIRLPIGTSVSEAVGSLSGQPGVAVVQPDYLYRPTAIPTDADFSQEWGLLNTGQSHDTSDFGTTSGLAGADAKVTTAWNTTMGDPSVVIAVIDTGVDGTHPDLMPNMWHNAGETPGDGIDNDHNGFIDDVDGWDFLNSNSDPAPDAIFDIHGTHVAGIIAAAADGSTGIVGVCPSCRIMPLEVGTDSGGLSDGAVIAAIHYAVRNGASIMNMSFGAQAWSPLLRKAIQQAGKAGVLSVISAGNASFDDDSIFFTGRGAARKVHSPDFPASFDLPTIISVAASDDHDRYGSFSSRGHVSVDLAAAGVDIYSTIPGGLYATLDGTSMAAPFVAGVAGLVETEHPSYSPVAVKNAILHGVDRPHRLAGGWTLTSGRLDAAKALGASPANATPRSDGTIAGAIRFVHAKKGTLSYPVDVNDVFRVRLKKAHRYLARLDVPKNRNFDLWVWGPGTLDVWQVEPGCGPATCHVVNAGTRPKGKDETVRFTAKATGVFYLIVTARAGAGKYALTLTLA